MNLSLLKSELKVSHNDLEYPMSAYATHVEYVVRLYREDNLVSNLH